MDVVLSQVVLLLFVLLILVATVGIEPKSGGRMLNLGLHTYYLDVRL